MNILLLVTGLGMGGAEIVVKELAIRLCARKHCVTVISLRRPEFFVRDLQGCGVRLLSGDLDGTWRDWIRLVRLAWRIWELKSDVVHAHLFHANMFARVLMGIGICRRIICSIHNTYEVGNRAGSGAERPTIRERLYQLSDSCCYASVQISRKGLMRFRELGITSRRRSLLIYNGVDLSTILTEGTVGISRSDFAAANEFLWVACGRFVEQKNFPLLLKVTSMLRTEGYKFRLWIFGDGPLREQYEAIVKRDGLENVVSFGGVRVDVRRLIRVFDAFVLSSNFEGLPVVLIEAAACALPIVTTDVGGASEILDTTSGGRVVPPLDETLLARAMMDIMNTETRERTEMGRANQRRATARFDLERIVTQWECLYRECATLD